METTQQTESKSVAHCAPRAQRNWLNAGNVAIAAGLLLVPALYFGWNWLVAAGLTSVVIGVLPCLAMCALGLCMGRMSKKDARE